MNTHIPQHVETTYELAELTAVPTQVIKPATSEPVIEVTNDTLIGAYLITQPHIKIPKKEVFNLLMTNHKFNGILPETSGDEWKGQDMFSMFLPDISFSKGNKSYDSNPDNKNNFVIIENGQFKQGILDKTVIGKTLIHMIYDSFGPNAVKDFLDNNQRMLNRWLTGHSFTVSLGDCTPTKEDNQKITEYISEKIKDVNTLIKQANTGVYKQNLDNKFIKISLENEIMGYLQSAVFAFQKYISKNINNESIIPNNIFSLINSGTKGSNDDLGQIRGFIGQATIMGHRIGNGFTRRSLTHFTKDDYGAKSRGFIANNFFNGLDPIELFFHQMNSREGSIDTAIKSVSGDTAIIIIEDGKAKYVKIGEWIDEKLSANPDMIEKLPEKDQELIKTFVPTFISTTDDNGNVSWGEITAVTRHDPGQEMYKIRTASGREVKVVESKSLIVWDEESRKFKEMNTPDIKIGNLLPVTAKLGSYINSSDDLLLSSDDVIYKHIENKLLNTLNDNGKFFIDNISDDLANEYAYLCSRISVFTEFKKNGIVIYWKSDNKYQSINDVVLDPIISIDKLPVEDYPKVYDVTVPSTLNFSLANGLQVRDTAESGYMQRRWIKALEDLTVKYGGTVRNGINNIVQFSYGDDGIDPCKLNKQDLKLVEMSDNELEKKFLITEEDLNMLKTIMVPEAYKEMTSQKDYVNLLKKDFDILRDMRNYARNNYFPDMNVMNTTVYSPLLFSRAIKNARDTFKIQMNKKSDLTPDYIRKCFQELEDELEKYLPSYSLNIFRCLLRSNLAIKLSMLEYRFNKTVFKFVIDNIREKYLSSIVQPGEMVGIIAAQSMGEKLTQMSVPGDTRILINISGKLVKTSIGEFIDSTIRSKNGKIFVDNSGKHTIMEINEDTKILSVSNDEKISWRKISKISRHPANGQLMKVETRTGRTTRATLSHSFLKRTINGIEPVEGSKLKVGDRIPLTLSVNEIENALTKMKIGEKDIDLDEYFGYFSAIFSMEGSTNKFGIKINRKPATDFTEMNVDRVCLNNGWPAEFKETVINVKNLAIADFMQKNFEQLPADKSIPAFIYQTNLEYIKGFLAGLIDISGNIDDKKMSIRFSSYSQQYLRELCLLFNYIGVYGYLGMDKRRDNEIYTLSITRKYIPLVNDVLNLNCFYKNVSLTKIINYVNRDEVHDVSEYIDKIPEVGEIIAETGKLLKLKDHARIYGRWKNKESIGRRTLLKYIDAFKMENSDIPEIKQNIKLLEQAANSDVVWDEIISIEYYDGPDDEYVYDFTVPGTESFLVDDSIMVHNTLNSVEWNTEILIKVDGEIIRTKIGEWIDNRIENADQTNIENHPNDTILEYIRDKSVMVPACTEEGKIIWDEVEAVTRHPVINKDGSNTLLKITTANGREVIATKAKSFLKRINNKIIGVDGDSIKVGDYLPVSKKDILNISESNQCWNISKYFSKKEFIYQSEVNKALEILRDINTPRNWWKLNNNSSFILPYGRSDSFKGAFISYKKRDINLLKDGCIYPKNIDVKYHIPENFELDNLNGFFFGAFLAEGHCTRNQLLISNIDENFNSKLINFANRYNIKYHIEDRIVNNGRSMTYRFHSYILCQLIEKTFGTNSQNKRIPYELLSSNKDFIKGLIEGYYSGDGYIPLKENAVLVTSVSKNLLEDMRLLLLRFNIKSSINCQEACYNYAIKNGIKAQMPYQLRINAGYTKLFADTFHLEIDSKNKRLSEKKMILGNRDDIIPDVDTVQWGKLSVYKKEISKLIEKSTNENDRIILNSILSEDIIYDQIVKIEEIVSEHQWVYDLTVKQTRNFNIYNGLCMRDTFHSVGVSAKAIITAKGIPRIREIINVAKTIKSPYMRIFLKDEFTSDVNKAKIISNQIEFTKLQDIVDKTMIIYENPNQETNSQEDMEFIQTYQEFASLVGVSQCPEDQLSRWVLRIVFNKEKMMNKNIYLSDIQDVIQLRNDVENDVQCTFSDDNAKELMLRIRVNLDTTDGDYLGFLQELEKVLMSITIRGIPGVEKVEPEMRMKIQYNSDGSYNQVSEWLLTTYGVNLLDVLMNENVDPNRTLSNDIHEINEIFGIEATRAIIIRELKMDDFDVNYRHLSLLGDIMTHRGVIMPIERHGINRSSERGPIAKATFEESTDILVKASTFAEKDKMGGVSANIMFGQLPKVGTNSFDLLFDESKFMAELKKVKENNLNKVIAESNGEEGLMKNIESKLANEYEENLGDIIDAQFGFSFDATKNSEKQLIPHLMPDTSLEIDDKKPKKKITMKKK